MGSYEQLIFVICDLMCAYFLVVTLYYCYYHFAISSKLAVHFIQLLLLTKPTSKTHDSGDI